MESRAEMIASQDKPTGIDPVLIMRIPTMISGICIFFVMVMQVHWYSNMHRREVLKTILGFIIIVTNMVCIFFASIHCPSVLVLRGESRV